MKHVRLFRYAAWLVVFIGGDRFANSAAAQSPGTVTLQALAAVAAHDWSGLVAVAHPDALERFRASELCRASNQERMVLDIGVPTEFRQERPAFSITYGVSSIQQLTALPTVVMLSRYFGSRHPSSQEAAAEEAGLSVAHRVIGTMIIGDSVAYVVVENDLLPITSTPRRLASASAPRVVSLKRSAGRWKTMLDGGIIWPMGSSLDTCSTAARAP